MQYTYGWQNGRPMWSTQRDEQYIKEAYNKVIWVYACVAMISSCVSSVPWCLYRRRGKNIVEIDEHPILSLVNNRINPYFSSKDFFDIWATYLALQGKFYAEYNNAMLPTQIYTMYPHFTNPIPNKDRFVQGFEYRMGDVVKIYDSNLVMWSKFNDPLDVYQGLSPIRAMSRTIDTENQAVDWNKTTLQNAAVPPGAIQVVNPSPELQEKLREEWLNRYSGSGNARVPLVLNAEKANYISFGMNPVDMDFLNQRKLTRIEICAGLGVPGQVVGDPEGQTYSNYSEALKAFWENTVIPRYLDNIKNKLNSDLVTRYADNLYLEPNLDNIKALHESVDAIAKRITALFEKNIITQNESRIALGYEELAEGNIFNIDLSGKLLNISTPSQDEQSKESNGFKKKAYTPEQLIFNNVFLQKTEKYIKSLKKLLETEFEKERKEIIKSIEKVKVNESEIMKAVENVIKSRYKSKKDILTATYISTIQDFGKFTFDTIKKQKAKTEFNAYDINIAKYVDKTTATEVVNINDTTMNEIKEITLDAIFEGLDIESISKNIDELYLQQIVPNRSELIARTETLSASNYGSLEGAIQADANVKKIWINTKDGKTRESHVKAGAHKPIPLKDKFDVGGSKMSFPGDFNAPAAEVCNCRCTIGYVYDEDFYN